MAPLSSSPALCIAVCVFGGGGTMLQVPRNAQQGQRARAPAGVWSSVGTCVCVAACEY